jgi:hypothetical protein
MNFRPETHAQQERKSTSKFRHPQRRALKCAKQADLNNQQMLGSTIEVTMKWRQ